MCFSSMEIDIKATDAGVKQVWCETLSCAHAGAPIVVGGGGYVLTALKVQTTEGRMHTFAIASDTPGNNGASLTNEMDRVGQWIAETVRDGDLSATTIFQIDSVSNVDVWVRGTFLPALCDGQDPRTVDALVRVLPGAMAVWLRHVAHVESLEHESDDRAVENSALDLGVPRHPIIGGGATIVHGERLYAATIYRIDGERERVGVRRDLVDVARYGELLTSSYIAHPYAQLEWFERDERGAWVDDQTRSLRLSISGRNLLSGVRPSP